MIWVVIGIVSSSFWKIVCDPLSNISPPFQILTRTTCIQLILDVLIGFNIGKLNYYSDLNSAYLLLQITDVWFLVYHYYTVVITVQNYLETIDFYLMLHHFSYHLCAEKLVSTSFFSWYMHLSHSWLIKYALKCIACAHEHCVYNGANSFNNGHLMNCFPYTDDNCTVCNDTEMYVYCH